MLEKHKNVADAVLRLKIAKTTLQSCDLVDFNSAELIIYTNAGPRRT